MEFLLIIGLVVYLVSLSRRVTALEEKLKGKEMVSPMVVQQAVQHADNMQPQTFSPIPPPKIQETLASVPAVDTPVPESAFVAWLKKDFMVKLGGFLLLLAFGWFVSYAFANNWIGPWGRIIAGSAFGAVVFSFGAYRMRAYREQGSIFVVLGSSIVIMTIYAAREIYDFFTPTTALALMGLTVALTAVLSVKYRLAGLAMAGLVMGAVAPLFTASPEPNLFGLSLYLLVLVAGALWVVFLISAPALTPVALTTVALYSLPYLSYVNEFERMQGLLFAFAFTALFLLSNSVSLIRDEGETANRSHMLSGLGTGLYLFFWIYGATDGWFESVLYSAFIVVFLLSGFFVYARTARRSGLYIYGAVAVGYLAAVTANIFDGAALTMVYAVELAGLVVASRLIPAERKARKALALLYVPLCLASLEHVASSNWVDSVLHRDFGALLIVTASLIVSGISLRLGKDEQKHLFASGVLLGVSGMYVLVQIGLVLHALLPDSFATTLTLAVYTAIGVLVYCVGARYESLTVQKAGMYLSFAGVPMIMVSLQHVFASSWNVGVLHTDSLALCFITAMLWLIGSITLQPAVRMQTTLPARVLLTLAGAYSFTLLWLFLHSLLSDGLATTLALITYTIVGLGLYVVGRQALHPYVMHVGAVVIGGVVLRLLFVEVWALSLAMRIITFFVIGILLISTAFIGRKKE